MTDSMTFVCRRGDAQPCCSVCGKPGTVLCDYELAEGADTCDASLCAKCTQTRMVFGVGRIDYCPKHWIYVKEMA